MTDNIDDFLNGLCGEIDDRFDGVARNERSIVAMRRSRTGDAVCISLVKTEPGYERQGFASDLLKTVCRAADEADVTLFLEVARQVCCEMTEGELAEWYRRRVFRGDPSEMIREPMATGKGDDNP